MFTHFFFLKKKVAMLFAADQEIRDFFHSLITSVHGWLHSSPLPFVPMSFVTLCNISIVNIFALWNAYCVVKFEILVE